jgi:hypothetical protein
VGNSLPTEGLCFTVDPALVNNPIPANAGLSIDDAVGNKLPTLRIWPRPLILLASFI